MHDVTKFLIGFAIEENVLLANVLEYKMKVKCRVVKMMWSQSVLRKKYKFLYVFLNKQVL